MAIVTKTQLENAALDVVSIEQFVNGAADLGGTGIVTSRLGETYPTLAKLVDDAEAWIALIEAETAGDAVATAADRVQTGNDVLATAADRVQTGLDRAEATAQAGVATTKAGEADQAYAATAAIYGDIQAVQSAVAESAANALATEEDKTATAADVAAITAIYGDIQEVQAAAASSAANALATEEDKTATAADALATAADAVSTAADRVQTGNDALATAADAVATAADRVQTGLDRAEATAQAGIATTKAGEAAASAALMPAFTGDDVGKVLTIVAGPAAAYEPPIAPAHNDIIGGDITVAGNTLTIKPCGCWDSTRTVWLETTENKTIVLSGTINQDFFGFIVRLLDGTFGLRAYTTLVEPLSDNQINAWRQITYAKNNGSGVTMPYIQVGNRIAWITSNRPILTPSLTTSYVVYSISSLLPIASLFELSIISFGATGCYLNVSYDGVTPIYNSYNSDPSGPQCIVAAVSQIYMKTSSGSVAVHIISAELRR